MKEFFPQPPADEEDEPELPSTSKAIRVSRTNRMRPIRVLSDAETSAFSSRPESTKASSVRNSGSAGTRISKRTNMF
jgi:hypothetical protein